MFGVGVYLSISHSLPMDLSFGKEEASDKSMRKSFCDANSAKTTTIMDTSIDKSVLLQYSAINTIIN